LSSLLAGILASTLILSAAYKVARPIEIRDAIGMYGIGARIAPVGRSILGRGLGLMEFLLAVALLFPKTALVGTVGALILFGGFEMVLTLDRRVQMDVCGCWRHSRAGVRQGYLVLRNGLLLFGAGALLALKLSGDRGPPSFPVSLTPLLLGAPIALLLLELPNALAARARREVKI
jgi:hypothetical protein